MGDALSFREEISQFLDEVSGTAHIGEPLDERIHHIIREGVDVLGKAVRALDETNPDELVKLVDEATDAANWLIGRLVGDKPLVSRMAKLAATMLIDPAVRKLADSSGAVDDFLAEHILPRLARIEETVHRVRVELGG